MPRVTLLSDFGTRDGYVGVMKGVLATRDPRLLLDDIAHDIPQGDIRKAARVLGRVWRAYPEGTVHLVVVDPGGGDPAEGSGPRPCGALLSDGLVEVVVRDGSAEARLGLGPGSPLRIGEE